MSHLRVEKRKRPGGTLQFCEGCTAKTTTGVRKSGLWILWVIGRPTYVCNSCAKSMSQAYEDALAFGFPEKEEVAV